MRGRSPATASRRTILRSRIDTLAAALTLVGIFAMRWNVVIGGQLFSKSFLGYTTYKMAFAARPFMIEVSELAKSAGGGVAVGFKASWRWIAWFMAWDMLLPIQNGSERTYTPSSTYQAATAN